MSNTFWFRVSPNPGPGAFRLDINTPAPEQVDLRLYNSNKALVWSEDHLQLSGRSQKTLHFEKFAPGLYLLDIRRTSGTVTEKVIITR